MNPFILPPDTLLKDPFKTAILPDVLDTLEGYAEALNIVKDMMIGQFDTYSKRRVGFSPRLMEIQPNTP